MKKNEAQNFIKSVHETEIDIRAKDGKIEKTFAKGTAGGIAFVFAKIYANVIIGLSEKTSENGALEIMAKIQESATKGVKEHFAKAKK